MEFHENVRNLIELHEREGVVHKPVDFDDFYKKEVQQTVSFEIAFTAFIATVTLATPRTGTILDWIIPWVGGGLLLLTLVRRIALDNVFIKRNAIFQSTLSYVIYLAAFSVLYLSLSLAEIVGNVLGIGTYVITGGLLIVFVFGSFLIYEFLFRDFMLWGAITFYNEAVNESKDYIYPVRIGWMLLARFVLGFSMAEYNKDHYVLKRIYDVDLESERNIGRIAMLVLCVVVILIIAIVVGLFSFIVAWILKISLPSAFLLNLSLLFSFLPAVGLIEFVYVRYGSADIDDVTSGVDTLKVIVMMYLVILLHAGIVEQTLISLL